MATEGRFTDEELGIRSDDIMREAVAMGAVHLVLSTLTDLREQRSAEALAAQLAGDPIPCYDPPKIAQPRLETPGTHLGTVDI